MLRSARHLPEVRFDNPRLASLGLEVIRLETLRLKFAQEGLKSPQRVDFMLLLFVESGTAVHMVDFVEYALVPGDVLLVKPGQVQEWRLSANLQGLLLLVSPAAMGPLGGVNPRVNSLLSLDLWPVVTQAGDELFRQALADIKRLGVDLAAFDGGSIEIAIAHHALVTLLLRLAHQFQGNVATKEIDKNQTLYHLFTRQLDKYYRQSMGVLDHARQLGYSESALSRACLNASGYTAKQLIDRRVALEAKRLLAHSQAPVAHIAHQVGFSESTNFVKFFRRLCDETPLSFRQRFQPAVQAPLFVRAVKGSGPRSSSG